MSRMKMVILVVLPVVLILGTALVFGARFILEYGLENERNRLTSLVINKASEIRQASARLALKTDTMAWLISDNKTRVEPFLVETIREDPLYYAVTIAYDPEFLADYRAGKYPDYQLENTFDLLKPGENPEYFTPSVVQDDGKLNFFDNRDEDYYTNNWYIAAKNLNTGYWSEPQISRTQTLIYAYSAPFHCGETFAGVICTYFNVGNLFKDNFSGVNLSTDVYGGEVFYLAYTGKILFHSRQDEWQRLSLYSLVSTEDRDEVFPQLDVVLQGNTGYQEIEKWGWGLNDYRSDENTWFVYTPLQNRTGGILAITFRESNVMATIYRMLTIFWIVGIVIVLLLTAAVTAVVLVIFQPIRLMTQVSQQVAAGNFHAQLPEKYTRKNTLIGELARNVNHMVANLDKNIKGIVVEREQRTLLEHELQFAQQIQNTFHPHRRSLSLDNFAIDARLMPAHYVAGDFYDFWQFDDDTFALLIGDVSGKGVAASLVMVAIRTLIRQIAQKETPPGDVLTEANESICRGNDRHMFATVFFGIYHRNTGLLRFCNAAHDSPAAFGGDDSFRWIGGARNSVLGVFSGEKFVTEEATLLPGENLVLYTDGVTEARPQNGETYGRRRLQAFLSAITAKKPNDIIDAIILEIEAHSKGRQADDMTILSLRRGREE